MLDRDKLGLATVVEEPQVIREAMPQIRTDVPTQNDTLQVLPVRELVAFQLLCESTLLLYCTLWRLSWVLRSDMLM